MITLERKIKQTREQNIMIGSDVQLFNRYFRYVPVRCHQEDYPEESEGTGVDIHGKKWHFMSGKCKVPEARP